MAQGVVAAVGELPEDDHADPPRAAEQTLDLGEEVAVVAAEQDVPVPLGQGGYRPRASANDRVNITALRDITDDSGGRTEIIRDTRDLDPARGLRSSEG